MRRTIGEVIVGLVVVSATAFADAKIDAVAKEVGRVRGLPVKASVPSEVIDKTELRARIAKDPANPAVGAALERWGMIPVGTDYVALMAELQNDQLAGYYDTKTHAMTIVGTPAKPGDDTTWPDLVLVHELDHALQDQAFDLAKYESLPASESDAALARRGVVEGDGIAVMFEVLMSRKPATDIRGMWMNPQVADMIQKEMSVPSAVPGGDLLDRAPLAVRERMVFPYRAGFGFVAALRRHQPWSAVDAAFAKPPRSTEQILHPERYPGDVPISISIELPHSPAGFGDMKDPVDSSVWGELGFDSFLRTHGIGAIVAGEASMGWGGDRAILIRDETGHAIGISRSEWDSEADAIEAAEALTVALDAFVLGGSHAATPTKTVWLALDGTTAWIERRGPSIAMAIGAPAYLADSLATEIWKASKVAKR